MYLSQVATKEQVFDAARAHPSLKVTSRTKNLPTLETAQKVVLNSLEYVVAKNIQEQLIPVMQDVLETHEMMYGKRDDCDTDEATDAWDEGLDTAFEAAIAPWVPYLSADWLGNNTISCGLHEDGAISKMGGSIGREVYKQLTYALSKTPNQILVNAGILPDEISQMLEQHIAASTNQTAEEKEAAAEQQGNEVETVVAKIAAHVGKEYNIMEVYNDLDLASDDDEILANGAAARLGISEQDVFALQMYRLEHGGDTPDKLDAMLKQVVSGKAKPAKKRGKEKPADEVMPATPKTPRKGAKAADALPEAGTIDASIFTALKVNGGAGDKDMAEGMGLSRATYNNFVNGKTPCVPSPEQYQFIRGQLVTRAQALLDALGALDGTQPHVVG
jgi:hypothetical protein